jgi:hypothetical protein
MISSMWIKCGIVAALFAFVAAADEGSGGFASTIVGSTPNTMVGGVASGAAPWTVQQGRAIVTSNGDLIVEVHGLLIAAGTGVPANLVGTTGPVNMVAASLVCGGSGGAVAASTGGVPLSARGDAEIEAKVTLPAQCTAPVVLVRFFDPAAAPGSQLGVFIALTGFNAGSSSKHEDDN